MIIDLFLNNGRQILETYLIEHNLQLDYFSVWIA